MLHARVLLIAPFLTSYLVPASLISSAMGSHRYVTSSINSFSNRSSNKPSHRLAYCKTFLRENLKGAEKQSQIAKVVPFSLCPMTSFFFPFKWQTWQNRADFTISEPAKAVGTFEVPRFKGHTALYCVTFYCLFL